MWILETKKKLLYILDSSGSDTFEPPVQGKVKEKRNAHTAAEQKRRDTIKVNKKCSKFFYFN